ncbi:phage portal protein [Burkholderia thailandensis]|uniref:phage portal protein n=1 Tax=Burkholderia thailandensis TaxID=57975 RepID=UPI000CABABE2|nr:phage portal protein [Burkholderia thailandensis]MCS6490769.1 phage portal protein [Burkholderia thailandensis]MCS6518145.1 phage portal protein [Burkholderia thailandensis]PJO72422.1 phage portal protein [Burkholderia thailandensis]
MSLVDRMLNRFGFERRADGESYWENFATLRGTRMGPLQAQSISTVYACVQSISETIASLPLFLYRKMDDDGREPASDHPLYKVLHDAPNPQQTALEFREQMQASVLLRGNAYARIVRGWDGQVRELWPVHPDRMSVLVLQNGNLGYEWTDRKGKLYRSTQDEILHLRHRTDDGILGVSPVTMARQVIELAAAERDHGNATFNNGTRLSGILKFPQKLKKEQRENLKASWDSQYAGGANAGKTAVLEEGVDYQTISMTLEDAEWIAARQFSVEEVCRLFRMPPTMVGDLRFGNYSNSVELARQFVTLTLRRHLVMWEQAIARSLLSEAGARTYFAEHSVEGLLRGDASNRADFYDKGIKAGWMLKSEARRLENLPAIQGIDHDKMQTQDAGATGQGTGAASQGVVDPTRKPNGA